MSAHDRRAADARLADRGPGAPVPGRRGHRGPARAEGGAGLDQRAVPDRHRPPAPRRAPGAPLRGRSSARRGGGSPGRRGGGVHVEPPVPGTGATGAQAETATVHLGHTPRPRRRRRAATWSRAGRNFFFTLPRLQLWIRLLESLRHMPGLCLCHSLPPRAHQPLSARPFQGAAGSDMSRAPMVPTAVGVEA